VCVGVWGGWVEREASGVEAGAQVKESTGAFARRRRDFPVVIMTDKRTVI